MDQLIPVLLITLAAATALNIFLRRFNIPTVIGYIIAGAFIGSIMGVEHHGNEDLEHIAEFGIVFLMFTIGLEFSANHLLSMKREVFLFGLLQVAITGAVFAALASAVFGIPTKSAILAGLGCCSLPRPLFLKSLTSPAKSRRTLGEPRLGC